MTSVEGSSVRRGYVSPRLPGAKPAAAAAGATEKFSDFIYNGGPVIDTPQVHILFVGDWSSMANQSRRTRLTQFVTDLFSSRYMNILSQYGCGTTGTVASTTTVSAPDSDLSTTDVHNIIQTEINNNSIPEPTDQATCALLYLDDATGVHDGDVVMCEATSDDAFGYHDHFVTTAGHTYPFAVVPGLTDTCLKNSCAADSTCSLHLAATQEQRQTQVTSHELSEMFSNPQVGSNEAWSRPGSPHENGDICNGQSATITVGPNTWTVQKMYSKTDDMKSKGATTCIADSDPLPSLLPQTGEHFYTISVAERDNCIAHLGFRLEGTAGWVFGAPPQNVMPFYRLFNNDIGKHFFTTSLDERDNAISRLRFSSEGLACWAYGGPEPGASDLFRCFNPDNSDHFYTTSAAERDNAVANDGYQAEGTACWVHTASQPGTTDLFRLFHP